jgi:hypothetical protein
MVYELLADRDSGQLRHWQGDDSASPSICSERKVVVLEMIEGRVCCGKQWSHGSDRVGLVNEGGARVRGKAAQPKPPVNQKRIRVGHRDAMWIISPIGPTL